MRATLLLVLVSVSLTGCRLYGGYGSEEAFAAEIEHSATVLAADLARMQGDRAALQQNASMLPDGEMLLASLDSIAEKYAELNDKAASMAANLAGSGNYRVLHRGLGAIVSDQQILQDRYRRLLTEIASQAGTLNYRGFDAAARYQVEPVFFARIRASLERVNMRDALAS